ncbi:MAG: multiheme c-type cytochrome [bacterium]|nr:multiheme c-type cytochrome [bacterium]MDI1336980.1 multiheme c-type cytochrome [Lacunisphaera sp.]
MALLKPRRWIQSVALAALLPLPVIAAPAVAKTGGPASCAECHLQEIEAWKLSVHFKTLNTMHRRPETVAMLAKLDLKNMKSEASCIECHYTSELVMDQSQVTTGISCESCHGAGADWVKTHGDYGEGVTKATESTEHRTRRRATAIANGMLNPDNLYGVGANCYGCHILNDEKVANVGGHSAGSAGFNLLTWSQGEVRHTILAHDNKANPEATPEHRRLLYLVGCILETEFSFRATARATEKAAFGITSARRADAARKQLEKIQSLAPTPELAPIITVAKAAGLRLNNVAELTAAADRIATLGHELAERVTGDKLAALDPLLPDSAQYKGTPYQVVAKP